MPRLPRLAPLAVLALLCAPAQAQGPSYRAPVAQAQDAAQPQPAPKFPNKDTAKNRQDYEMGTDSGGTVMGRDAQTGESVVIHVSPKKNPPAQDVEKPIEVKPVVPLIWK